MTATATTQAAQLLATTPLTFAQVEAQSRSIFAVDRPGARYDVRRFADGSRLVVYPDAAEFADYAALEAEVVGVLQRYDEGAYGASPADAAEDWIRQGYTAVQVDAWLAAGVCFPSHADELAAEGVEPATLTGVFTGWATDEEVAEYLYGPEDPEDPEDADVAFE